MESYRVLTQAQQGAAGRGARELVNIEGKSPQGIYGLAYLHQRKKSRLTGRSFWWGQEKPDIQEKKGKRKTQRQGGRRTGRGVRGGLRIFFIT